MHQKILSKNQLEAFERLRSIEGLMKEMGFHLFGGTALALQIGHRKSYDFDFLTREEFSPIELSKKLNVALDGNRIAREAKNTLDMEWKDVKLSFFGNYSRAFLKKPIPYEHLELLQIPDIMAMKIHAMRERTVIRDYFDVATVLQFEGVSVKNIIQWFHEKYGEDAKQVSDYVMTRIFYGVDEVPEEKQLITAHQEFWRGKPLKVKIKEIMDKKVKEYLEEK